MPKRKRSTFEDDGGDHVSSMQKKDVIEKLSQSRKLLHRALKTAKGFERQKLGKRLKLAKESNSLDETVRINREIEALKGLDLGKATEAQLCRVLLKVKAFAESDLLPEEVKNGVVRWEGSEEEIKAVHNVVSGMCNMKNVKGVMGQLVGGMYIAMGIPAPVVAKGKAGLKKEPGKSVLKNGNLGVPRRVETASSRGLDEEVVGTGSGEPSWEGFDSGDEDEEIDEEGGAALNVEAKEEELDEEALSRYDALLGGSSDEESFDESTYLKHSTSQPSTRLSLSLSPEPSSPSESKSQSSSPSPSPSPQKAPKPTKAKKEPPRTPAGSTFLPTLMGGYWSGSESSASDLEDDVLTAAPVRKNRPGQTARRAIWEKKFGAGANHIKSGKGPVKGKDDGWDVKRGATDGSKRGRGREGGFGERGRGGRQRDFRQATGENAMPLEPKKKTRDDVGILHPSWEAAKKAKEMKKTATFQGKKVTFD